MKTIILIGCGAKKASTVCKAQDMYQGILFRKAFAYAQKLKPDKIYILSAKHHLLGLDTIIEPYNETLNDKKIKEKQEWSQKVIKELQTKGCDLQRDKFIFLAGKNYYKYIEPAISHCEFPYSGCKGIGYILEFLTNQIKN